MPRLISSCTSHQRAISMTSINCLWLALLLGYSCNIFGLLRLEQHLAEALPFEYLDEHVDEFNYDLDEAQSQAKYDARLLSEQMLSDAELQQRADIESGISSNSNSNSNNNNKNQENNFNANSNNDLAAEDDLEPHSRAAACFTNGHKYTHGQKVPRLDACEVCLCMDGEIFCWWEKCDKANVNKAETAAAATTTAATTLATATAAIASDYSDPYRYETTTRKSTKVHKMGRKAGKRHKHHKNQKNFNDYEVYQSRKQAPDYEKPDIKQQQQQQELQQEKSDSIGNHSSEASNYNIIKQHKHEPQQQKLATATLQQQQQQQLKEPLQQQLHISAAAVNQAAKETHYQQQLPTPQQQHQHQQQHQQHQQQQQQQQQHLHAHQQPHSSSKILNFPENLPALLYYDYKTEEHEHHQHQHHQQHLLHEKQRLQQQQLRLQQQQQQQQQKILQKANTVVELHTVLGIDKNFDEAETDSDILPEPPTKRPATTLTTSSNGDSNGNSNGNSKATTMASAAVATTIEMMTTPRSQQAATAIAMANTNLQQDQEIEEADDAFHRWLTSTELNVDSTNTLDDSLTAAAAASAGDVGAAASVAAEQQEIPASTIIDDVGINKSNTSSSSSSSSTNSKDNGNRHGNNIADNADAVFFRSSYNDYSSEFNGSVVNIDITLTAVDVHPQRPQQQQQQQQQQHLPKAQTDLIANDNQTSDVGARQQTTMQPTAAATTAATSVAAAAAAAATITPRVPITNSSNGSSNQYVPPYTLTTIITTTPLATGRMCNVLGKLYKIGEILPQDTGNCLQCICTDAVTPDELPSVTCSPHNCPPLVLPDLFDATGY